MANNNEELKKELAQALRIFEINVPDELTEKKLDPEEDRRDFEEMSIATRNKIEELTEKREQVVRQTGMSPEQLEAFGANPNNFNKEQWEALQKIKEVTSEYKRISMEELSEEALNSPGETKKTKSRKIKKKDWIPL